METGIVATASALVGVIVGKLLDTALGWRKVDADKAATAAALQASHDAASAALAASELAATRAWYASEFASLRALIEKQDAKIELLKSQGAEQVETIRQHEGTIATLRRDNDLLRQRVEELEGKATPQAVVVENAEPVVVRVVPSAGC